MPFRGSSQSPDAQSRDTHASVTASRGSSFAGAPTTWNWSIVRDSDQPGCQSGRDKSLTPTTIVACATWSRPFSVNDRGLNPRTIEALAVPTGVRVGVAVRLVGVPDAVPGGRPGVPAGVAARGAAATGVDPPGVATTPGTGVLAGGGTAGAGAGASGGAGG